MDSEEQQNSDLFFELSKKYKEKFGVRFGVPVNSYLGTKDGIEIMGKCLKTNTPYKFS